MEELLEMENLIGFAIGTLLNILLIWGIYVLFGRRICRPRLCLIAAAWCAAGNTLSALMTLLMGWGSSATSCGVTLALIYVMARRVLGFSRKRAAAADACYFLITFICGIVLAIALHAYGISE